MTTRLSLIAALTVLLAPVPARAQAPAAESGRFEVGVAPIWIGGASLGDRAANETTRDGGAVPLFTTTTTLDATIGVEFRFGVRVTRHIDVEAAGSYARPPLVATVRSDFEAGPGPFTAEERVRQFSMGGTVLWRLRALRRNPRWTPFVIGGVRYVRQLHETETLLEDGEWYEAGGGVKYLIRSNGRGLMKSIGVRGDVRAIVRTASLDVDGRAHVSPAFAASFYVRF
ncbi:MAG TPA: hypothetical protein VKH42_20460 [Vicinamibacterales bacterium]|nr:hypothetical protein [Vicinamibacterales bacterium]